MLKPPPGQVKLDEYWKSVGSGRPHCPEQVLELKPATTAPPAPGGGRQADCPVSLDHPEHQRAEQQECKAHQR